MTNRLDSVNIRHIGQFVRDNIIPRRLTVTEAARLLGVGRPALSNFLNGRAKLSSRMALRLERAFGADSEELLSLQAEIERKSTDTDEESVVTGTYAPSILPIRAGQIDQWAKRIETRSRLPVLVRKLVDSSGSGIVRADFPGYDDAEQPGWDGYVESSQQTQWIPRGVSGWELGTSERPRQKADRDYRARLDSVPHEERGKHSFIFVTPRSWPGKDDWASEKRQLGHWLDVRAYDARDLERWVEQSVSAQVWLAEDLGIPVTGYRSLESCWKNWSAITDPPLSPSLFKPAIAVHAGKLARWVGSPPSAPMVIAADSKDEVLAFISCLPGDEPPGSVSWANRTVVFDTRESLQRLAHSLPRDTIAVSSSTDVEIDLALMSGDVHCVFVRPRGLVGSDPDIALDRLSRDDFRSALEEMQVSRDEVDRLDRESARAPTILRRRLSKYDLVRVPPWAGDPESARKLTPIALMGTWDSDSRSDQEIAKILAQVDVYESVESDVLTLLRLEDPPVWNVGQHRGVVSAIDSLFAVGWCITDKQLDDFFVVAAIVLSEHDPSLDLSPDRQWAAAIYGKVRDHSAALRTGILGTLVLLATYGDDIPGRSAIGIQGRVDRLVRNLIIQHGNNGLMSLHRDLPDLAEAAPDEFLRFVEQDLALDDPDVRRLFEAESDPLFSTPKHTGLLWALERLAWNPDNLPRVIRILLKLCPYELPSNLGNTPMATLQSIFRCWVPQTAANLDQRIQALETLTSKCPAVGWDLCTQQIFLGGDIGKYNERPRWRSDASGVGHGVPVGEREQFRRKAVELALAWLYHDEKTLGDLVDKVEALTRDDRIVLWRLIQDWADEAVDTEAKAGLWNRLRIEFDGTTGGTEDLQEVIDGLQPSDPVLLHRWMFSWNWTRYPETSRRSEADYEVLERRVREKRLDALREIWSSKGFEGLTAVIESSDEAPHFVGMLMPEVLKEDESLAYFALACIDASREDNSSGHAYCLRATLQNTCPDDLVQIIERAELDLSEEGLLFLFLCLPFRGSTWELVEQSGEHFREEYWKKVMPISSGSTSSELNELVDRLLEVRRPFEAFNAVDWHWKSLETSRLTKLLRTVASVEPYGRIDQYSLSFAFDALDERPDVSTVEKASLEFTYITGLTGSEHGISNLELLISTTPSLFVEMIEAVYGEKPQMDSQDEPQMSLRQAQAMSAFSTLQMLSRTPGSDEDGRVDQGVLLSWLEEARTLSAELGLRGACDSQIGQLLSRATTDDDGHWPCRAVCEAMELLASNDALNGFLMGVYNSRGAEFRGSGGEQERELAQKYIGYSQRLAYEYPFTSRTLRKLAEGYESEATWWDDRSEVDDRLQR